MSGGALLAGYVADLATGDPRRWHPVAGFGMAAAALERTLYAPTRLRGALVAGGLVAGAATLAELLARGTPRITGGRQAALAAVTWAALGGRSLRREALRDRGLDRAPRPRRGATRAARAVRARRQSPGHPRSVPGGGRVGRREHQRRGRRRARLGNGRRTGGRRGLPGGEHARRDVRTSQRPLRVVRLGRRSPRRRDELAGGSAFGRAHLRRRSARRRSRVEDRGRRPPVRRRAPEPQRGPR